MEVVLRLFRSRFPEDEYHINSEVIRQCFLQKLSEMKGMQKLEEFVVANFHF